MAFRLLDTNVVSFIMKSHPLAAVYQPHLTGFDLAVSFQAVAELVAGGALAGWGDAKWAALDATLANVTILQQRPNGLRALGGSVGSPPGTTHWGRGLLDRGHGTCARIGTRHAQPGGFRWHPRSGRHHRSPVMLRPRHRAAADEDRLNRPRVAASGP